MKEELTLSVAIDQLRSGNQDAFTHIYHLFFTKFRNYFHFYTARHDIAEELTHDIFLKLWVFHEKLPPGVDIESYLFIMARNCLYNHLKRKRKEYTVHQTVMAREPIVTDPAVQQAYQQTLEEYHACLNELDEEHRTIFLLSREEGLTNQQIAEQLGISYKMVRRKMETILKMMRSQLQPLSFIILTLLILA